MSLPVNPSARRCTATSVVEVKSTHTSHSHTEGLADAASVASSRGTEKRRRVVARERILAANSRSSIGKLKDGDDARDENDSQNELRRRRHRRACCAVPLLFSLAAQCLVVIVAFTAIVVTSDTVTNSMAKDLIEHGIRTELKYAESAIQAPIVSAELQLLELRERYLSYMQFNKYPPCAAVYTPLLQDSAGFFADTIMAMSTNPQIGAFTQVTFSKDYLDIRTGTPAMQGCLSNQQAIFTVYQEDKFVTLRPPAIEDFKDLDQIPLITDAARIWSYIAGFMPHIYASLASPRISWTSLLTDELFMVASVPLNINRTTVKSILDANGTKRVLSTTVDEIMPQTSELQEPLPAVSLRYVGEVHTEVTDKATSVLSMSLRMADYLATMKAITPSSAGAHTSLYDLNRGVLLATSAAPTTTAQYTPDGALYTAGNVTAYAGLDDAFRHVRPETLSSDQVHIHFGTDTVYSGYLFATSSGVRFALVQATPREHYFGTMVTLRIIMIVIGIVSAIVVVAACFALGMSVRASLNAVQGNMVLAAAMKNDRVDEDAHVSWIWEMQQLSTGFAKMNQKLLEARAYLPQHLLVTTDEEGSALEEDGDDHRHHKDMDDGDEVKSVNISGRSSVARGGGGSVGRAGNAKARNYDSESTATDASNNRYLGVGAGNRFAAGASSPLQTSSPVVTKRVTVLSINARSFHATLNPAAPATVVSPTTDLTRLISEICHANKGVIDQFHGDHFVLSFNAARHNAEGPKKAAAAALETMLRGGMDAAKPLCFSMGIATGRAAVGHLGTPTLKRLSIVGGVYSRAMTLERLCRRLNGPAGVKAPAKEHPSIGGNNGGGKDVHAIDDDDGALAAAEADVVMDASQRGIQVVCDGTFVSEVQHSFILQVLGGISGGPFSSSPSLKNQHTNTNPPVPLAGIRSLNSSEVLYAIRDFAQSTTEADEWLYELQSSQQNSANARLYDVNAAMLAYLAAQPPIAAAAAAGTSATPVTGGPRGILLAALDAIRQRHIDAGSSQNFPTGSPSIRGESTVRDLSLIIDPLLQSALQSAYNAAGVEGFQLLKSPPPGEEVPSIVSVGDGCAAPIFARGYYHAH